MSYHAIEFAVTWEDNDPNKKRVRVYDWPDKIRMKKRYLNMYDPNILDVDNNIIDICVWNGRARYYINHGIEDDEYVYAKKFYHFTY